MLSKAGIFPYNHFFFADTLKGSYYANPIVDTPEVTAEQRQAYPEYYGSNICGSLTGPRIVHLNSSCPRAGG